MENLTVSPTRTIVTKNPDGTKETIKQTVTFTRTATFDEVTGEVAYSKWQTKGTAKWPVYKPKAISGYTANPASIVEEAVTPETTGVTVNVTYVPIKMQRMVKIILLHFLKHGRSQKISHY